MAQYNRFFVAENTELNAQLAELADANMKTAQAITEYGNKLGGAAHFFTESHTLAGFEFDAGVIPAGWEPLEEGVPIFMPTDEAAKEEIEALGPLASPDTLLSNFGLAGHYIEAKNYDNAIAVPVLAGNLADGPVVVVVPWDEDTDSKWSPPEDWREVDTVEANKVMAEVIESTGQEAPE